jgi:hypothetical protein
MIQASGWEDTATDESKVLVHIAEITGDDLRMTDGEGFVISRRKGTSNTHLRIACLFLRSMNGWLGPASVQSIPGIQRILNIEVLNKLM